LSDLDCLDRHLSSYANDLKLQQDGYKDDMFWVWTRMEMS